MDINNKTTKFIIDFEVSLTKSELEMFLKLTEKLNDSSKDLGVVYKECAMMACEKRLRELE